MWVPTKKIPATYPAGWYCLDTTSGKVALLTRRSSKQASQKVCNHKNTEEEIRNSDKKKRNPTKWYTVAYLEETGRPDEKKIHHFFHHFGYGSTLLSEVKDSLILLKNYHETLRLKNKLGSLSAVIWLDRLTKKEAVHGPSLPWHHVSQHGEIS